MLKLKDGITIDSLKKYGIRKHRDDPDDVIASKWGREWCSFDVEYGSAQGGWEFSPVLYIKKVVHCGKDIYVIEGRSNFIYYMPTPSCLETIYKLTRDDLIEIFDQGAEKND